MAIKIFNGDIAEIISDTIVISNSNDGLDIVGNAYYQGVDKVLLYEKNITPDFFDLKTKMAGEILQKFSNYRMKLAIVGSFDYHSNSLNDFISESNKLGNINFVSSKEEAIQKLNG